MFLIQKNKNKKGINILKKKIESLEQATYFSGLKGGQNWKFFGGPNLVRNFCSIYNVALFSVFRWSFSSIFYLV